MNCGNAVNWNCKKCNGKGMFPTATGVAICDCSHGDRKKKYLSLSEKERREEFRGSRKRHLDKDKTKKTPEEAQEVIPF